MRLRDASRVLAFAGALHSYACSPLTPEDGPAPGPREPDAAGAQADAAIPSMNDAGRDVRTGGPDGPSTSDGSTIPSDANVVRKDGGAGAEADFAARCAAPGVVLCTGLNTEADLQAGEIGPAADGSRQGFVDNAHETSGGGSLRFTLRAGVSESNIGGYWSHALGKKFVSGDVLYVQWRQRITPEFLSNSSSYWRSSIKQINIHGPNSTCQGAEFTTALYDNKPEMYTNCGDGFDTDATNNTLCNGTCGGDILLQQGSSLVSSPNGDGYNCHYNDQSPGTGDGSGCFFFPPNVWVTYYEKITIGAFGGTTSAVDAWVAIGGGGYKQFHRASGIRFNDNRDDNFTRIRLETYMTELTSAAPVTTYTWFDELIVSTQPIAAPKI